MGLGKKIREFRRERGLTLTELAKQLQVSPSYLSALERGIRKPSLVMLRKIGNALNVPVGYLIASSDETLTGKKLRFLRESRDLTLEELSEISEIPVSLLEKYESGQAIPDLEDIKKLSEALNVTLRYFWEHDSNSTELGRRIRRLRERQGLTIVALAERAGVSPGLISQIENGQTTPLLNTLENIARALNVSVSYFLIEQEDVSELISTLNPEVLDILGDPQVQAVLRAMREFSSNEIKYVLNFIQFFKQNRHLL